MGGGIKKNTLSEIALFYGTINMPKGFEIDRDKLAQDILIHKLNDCTFPFSRTWDMLNTFLRDHVNVEYGINLINKVTTGDYYKPNTTSLSQLQVDPVDLRNSPDFVMLYGVNIQKDTLQVRIEYDDNRRKGRSWDININNNMFIMFPSTQRYTIRSNQKDGLNFLQTITYDYI
tara:strand:- start:83 stop:604 length:522 start_codon:yes stop_codon:yes gene_type:complete